MGYVAHHTISFYKDSARRFGALQKQYGFRFNLHSVDNMIGLSKAVHGRGRHKMIYHERVFAFLEERMKAAGKYGVDAKAEFQKALMDLKKQIDRDPGSWFGP